MVPRPFSIVIPIDNWYQDRGQAFLRTFCANGNTLLMMVNIAWLYSIRVSEFGKNPDVHKLKDFQ